MQATKPKRYTVNEKWDFVFIPPTILPTCLFLHDKRCKVAKYFQTHKHKKYKNTYVLGTTLGELISEGAFSVAIQLFNFDNSFIHLSK